MKPIRSIPIPLWFLVVLAVIDTAISCLAITHPLSRALHVGSYSITTVLACCAAIELWRVIAKANIERALRDL